MAKNIIIMGPQGAGKGTMAKRIAERYGIPHISTGNMFRKYKEEGTVLGIEAHKYWGEKGQLVPDDITIKLIKKRLTEPDCGSGYVLDGFPRTLPQAQALDLLANQGEIHSIDAVIALDVPFNATKEQHDKLLDVVIDRLEGRRTCKKCGAVYHVRNMPPKKEGVCDVDGGELYKREDDTPEKIKVRVEIYDDKTRPLFEYYAHAHGKDFVQFVDPTRKPDEIFKDIQNVLDHL